MKWKQLTLALILAKNSYGTMCARRIYGQLNEEFSTTGFTHPRGVATYLMKFAREVDESKYPNQYVI